jgi:regulatory protein
MMNKRRERTERRHHFFPFAYKRRSNVDPTVAQKWRMTRSSHPSKRDKKLYPLNQTRLRDMALRYVGRYATTKARLHAYLDRKVKERGWEDEAPPDSAALVEKLAGLGYIDDATYAEMKGAAMIRRGLGVRRVREDLQAHGVTEVDRANAEELARNASWDAAHSFARRKRIGPFAVAVADQAQRQKHIAAFLRAGHDFTTARIWVEAAPNQLPERDE